MNLYALPEDLANAILNYMADRPWREVNNLIVGMQNLRRVPTWDETMKFIQRQHEEAQAAIRPGMSDNKPVVGEAVEQPAPPASPPPAAPAASSEAQPS
jgi:hypothetical protein